MKIIDRVPIDRGESMLCERYYFELNGLKVLIVQFTSEGPFKPDNEKYKILLDKYLEANYAYNSYLSNITTKYIPQYISDKRYNYMIDFNFKEICIYENEGHTCSCN